VAKIFLTEKAIALEEVIRPFNLTGYLEVDSKTIPLKKIAYSISGLTSGYERSILAFGRCWVLFLSSRYAL
jgi:hypothetical protein